jgi:hypothetical protein
MKTEKEVKDYLKDLKKKIEEDIEWGINITYQKGAEWALEWILGKHD